MSTCAGCQYYQGMTCYATEEQCMELWDDDEDGDYEYC